MLWVSHTYRIRKLKSFPRVYTVRVYILFQCELINQAACDLAREVANEGDALVAGNFCQTPSYMSGLGKEVVQQEFKKQVDVFVKNDVDFLLGEVIVSVEIFPRSEFPASQIIDIA